MLGDGDMSIRFLDENREGYIEKSVDLRFQEQMESEGWETHGYEEYHFDGRSSVPRFVVMRKREEESCDKDR